jgi:hypothetical protein
MARTFPTAGLSPIDAYVTSEVPAGYFRHELVDTLDSALCTVNVITNCDLVSGGILQGFNSTITLGTSSTRGTTACAGYFKIDLGSADTAVSGRTSVLEARVDIGASSANPGTISCMCLDWNNLCTAPSTSWANSYIMLRDRVEDNANSCIRAFLSFYDHAALDDGGTTSGSSVIQDTAAEGTHNVSIACTYGPGNTRFYLMGTTTTPS